MKRLLHILLSALSFGGMSCVPFIEEEADMYAAPYTEFRSSPRVDAQEVTESDKSANTEEVNVAKIWIE